ncbi:MAG: transposase, partial [Bryobacterales bacterium]|nr:transposase [Bryobacterales bacterium]
MAQQSGGELGERENRQLAVRPAVATWQASFPLADRSQPPEPCPHDEARRKAAPQKIRSRTKPPIAPETIRRNRPEGLPRAPVLAETGYAMHAGFPEAIGRLAQHLVWVGRARPACDRQPRGPGPPTVAAGPLPPVRRSGDLQPLSVRHWPSSAASWPRAVGARAAEAASVACARACRPCGRHRHGRPIGGPSRKPGTG